VSKTIPGALDAHYALGTTTLAVAIKITRADGTVFGWTEHDVADTVSAVVYSPDPGIAVSEIVTSAGLQVGNLEIRTLNDETIFTAADIHNGVWRNAAFEIFRYNHQSPSDGIDPLLYGNVGEVRPMQNMVTVELLDLRQYLQPAVGSASSKTCRYRLGSTTRANGGLCTLDISGAPFTVSFTVTGVTSNRVFQDTARAEAEDYFGWGSVEWLTGNNAGVFRKVQSYAADGTFTLAEQMYDTVQVGDTGTAVVGCRLRRDEDCVTKFNNVLNFGGEPDRTGLDDLASSPGGSV